eukprot:TRINITY_DN9934_c0_g1_i2.p1 TRINITY_DN9934_c0_g1~~TRINITY_DN9934_c0_g1_i2.p1  ORF type:complete len:148 (+),score=23.42 TRINITY_DN9934_c0_g1_i2:146-589(+)
MIRRPPRSTLSSSSAASDVYKRQWDINAIRFGFAAFALGAVTAISSRLGCVQATAAQFEVPALPRRSWIKISLGVFLVTYICPACFTYALFKLNLASCLTLTSTGPVFALPITFLAKGEPITCKGVVGAVGAILGVVILCFGEEWRG